ncbi:YSIRK-type signal peptide-containing protein, partial [Staphylococcus aureus]|uniref:YSIRK-type signal peptide-containing protein n=1 Tax=Staphylococcus aureus TaxID=1280 RepID=UPI00351F0042
MRKYSIGVVSVLAATMFIVASHEAQASEKTPTSNAAAQKETLNQPGEQGNAITSHQMQSRNQLDDMHKENGKSGTVTEGKDTLHQPQSIVSHFEEYCDNLCQLLSMFPPQRLRDALYDS